MSNSIVAKGIVYKITNKITGEMYIGQTTKSLKSRTTVHKRDSRILKSRFYSDMRKFGWYHFSFEIIATFTNIEKEHLYEFEKYFIAFYDTFNDGYNETTGGKDYELSEEYKKKLSECRKGKKRSEESKLKQALSMQGENNHKFGKIVSDATRKKISDTLKNKPPSSEETRKKISEANKGRKRSDETRKKMSEAAKNKKI